MLKKILLLCLLSAAVFSWGCRQKEDMGQNEDALLNEGSGQDNSGQEISGQEMEDVDDLKSAEGGGEDMKEEEINIPVQEKENGIKGKYEGYAEWGQEKLYDNYWDSSTKSVSNQYPYRKEQENALNYWWKAHAADAMIDGYERTKDAAYAERAESIIKNIISRNGSLYNEFYDDMEWLALACLRLYDDTGNEKMKEYAEKLWKDIKGAWWEDEIGGMAWKKDEARVNRNACSNGPAAIIAARMYQYFGDEEDLEWAKKIFEFEKTYLVDKESGCVYDGLKVMEDGSLDINTSWLFTYNSGTYIGAAVELYNITGDVMYLEEAEKTAADAMNRFTTIYGVTKSEGTGDGGMFKGILIRYMYKLYEVNQDQDIADYILKNADKLMESGTTPDKGLIGPEWNKNPSGSLDVTCQLSGVFLLEAAARIEKEQGDE